MGKLKQLPPLTTIYGKARKLYYELEDGKPINEKKLKELYEYAKELNLIDEDGYIKVNLNNIKNPLVDVANKNPNAFDWDSIKSNPDLAKIFTYIFYLYTSLSVYGELALEKPQSVEEMDEEREEKRNNKKKPNTTTPFDDKLKENNNLTESESLNLTQQQKYATALIFFSITGDERYYSIVEDSPIDYAYSTKVLNAFFNKDWKTLEKLLGKKTASYLKTLVENNYINGFEYLQKLWNNIEGEEKAASFTNYIRKANMLYRQFLEKNNITSQEFITFEKINGKKLNKRERLALNYIIVRNYRDLNAYASSIAGKEGNDLLTKAELDTLKKQYENNSIDEVDYLESIYSTVKPRLNSYINKLRNNSYGIYLYNALAESNADLIAQAYISYSLGVEGIETFLNSIVYTKETTSGIQIIDNPSEIESAKFSFLEKINNIITDGLRYTHPSEQLYFISTPFNIATYIPDDSSIIATTATISRTLSLIRETSPIISPYLQHKYIGPSGHVENSISNFLKNTLNRIRQIFEKSSIFYEDPEIAQLLGEKPYIKLRTPEELARYYVFRTTTNIITPTQLSQRTTNFFDILKYRGLDPYLLQTIRAGYLGIDIKETINEYFNPSYLEIIRRSTSILPLTPRAVSYGFLEDLANFYGGITITGFDKYIAQGSLYYYSPGKLGATTTQYTNLSLTAYGLSSLLNINLNQSTYIDENSSQEITTANIIGKDLLSNKWIDLKDVRGRFTHSISKVDDKTLAETLDSYVSARGEIKDGAAVAVLRYVKDSEGNPTYYLYTYYKKGGKWYRVGIYKINEEEAFRMLLGFDGNIGKLYIQNKTILAATKDENGNIKGYRIAGAVFGLKISDEGKAIFTGLIDGTMTERDVEKQMGILFSGFEWESMATGNKTVSFISGGVIMDGMATKGSFVYTNLSGLEAFGLHAVKDLTEQQGELIIGTLKAEQANVQLSTDYIKEGERTYGGFRILGRNINNLNWFVAASYLGGLYNTDWGTIVGSYNENTYFHISYTKLANSYIYTIDNLITQYENLVQRIREIEETAKNLEGQLNTQHDITTLARRKNIISYKQRAKVRAADVYRAYVEQYLANKETIELNIDVIDDRISTKSRKTLTLTREEFENLFNEIFSTPPEGGLSKEEIVKLANLERQRRHLLDEIERLYIPFMKEYMITAKYITPILNGLGEINIEGAIFGSEGIGVLINSYVTIDRNTIHALGLSSKRYDELLQAYGGSIKISLGEFLILTGYYQQLGVSDRKAFFRDVVRAGITADPTNTTGFSILSELENIKYRNVDTEESIKERLFDILLAYWNKGSIFSTNNNTYYLLLHTSDGLYLSTERKEVGAKGGIIIKRSKNGTTTIYSLTAMVGKVQLNTNLEKITREQAYNYVGIELGLTKEEFNEMLNLILGIYNIDISNTTYYWDGEKLIAVEGDKMLKIDLSIAKTWIR